MELTKTSLYNPEDLVELLKTSGAPLSKIAEETEIPEPTLKNYKYGKTLIDSMPYRMVVELSRFFRQYDLSVEKLKSYGHVVLPKEPKGADSVHFECIFGKEFEENCHLYALRVLHLFTSRYDVFTECKLREQECSFEHVFVAMSSEIINLVMEMGANWLCLSTRRMFDEMTSLNITCVWSNSAFKDFSRYFNNEPSTSYDFIELRDVSVKTEKLMYAMKRQLFTIDYQLEELEYVEDLFSNPVVHYLLAMFGINPARYDDYRRNLESRSNLGIDYRFEGLFSKKRVTAEYEHVSFECNTANVKEMLDLKQFQLQMELYRKFDLEISQKYNFDEMLRKGTYETLFE